MIKLWLIPYFPWSLICKGYHIGGFTNSGNNLFMPFPLINRMGFIIDLTMSLLLPSGPGKPDAPLSPGNPSKPLSPLAPSKTAPGKPGIPWSPENRKGVLEFY